MDGTKQYRIRAFAALAGVSVRALHHYDRLGLLQPRRLRTGYRVYAESDLARLEQIVALKYIGVPLKAMKPLLEGAPEELLRTLARQRAALMEKQRLLAMTVQAVQDAEAALRRNPATEAAALRRIMEVMQMGTDGDWMMKYFHEDVRGRAQANRARWTPELQARAEQEWSDLYRDAEAALEDDPAGPRAQALASRWEDLIRQFTGGDQDLVHGVKALYADRANWPAGAQARMERFLNPRVWEFLGRASAQRRNAAGHGGFPGEEGEVS